MNNKAMFFIGTIVFLIYVYFYFRIVLRQFSGKSKKENSEN
jgi:phosphotransferase system  glucose/maltose/N-acetylglucosamine-specific IIC component